MPGPEKKYEKVLSVNFTPDQCRYMDRWSVIQKLPVADLIRDALDQFIKNNEIKDVQ